MSFTRMSGFTIVLGMMLGLGTGARPVQAEETFEEALGAATGMALYEVQMVLGLSADAFAKKVYDQEQMKTIVAEQKSMMEILNKYLEALRKLDSTSEDDKKSLQAMSDCIEKLKATAEALLAYVNDSSDENADAWQVKRKASYAAISDLLGLDKK